MSKSDITFNAADFREHTAEEVRDALLELADDQEAAHVKEDELMVSTLEAIRDGEPNPAELARRTLIVTDAEYVRWYA